MAAFCGSGTYGPVLSQSQLLQMGQFTEWLGRPSIPEHVRPIAMMATRPQPTCCHVLA